MGVRTYVGAKGTEIRLFCASDITTAVNPVISVRKPDGTETTWPAVRDGETLVYFTQAGDLAAKGEYRFQAMPNLPSWEGRGETAKLTVYDKFEV
jgi:hypothetical protein